MKKFLIFIFLISLINSSAFARSTGCKEGNCENGFGKWIYTDKTTYEGEWVATKKEGQGVETWPNGDRKSTRLNSSHSQQSRMPSSA